MLMENDLQKLAALLLKSRLLRTLSEADRSDLAQATIAILISKYDSAPISEAAQIAFGILRNLVLKRRREIESRPDMSVEEARSELSITDGDISDQLARTEAAEALAQLKAALSDALVEQLTPYQQELINDRFFDKQTLREIAESREISISTAHRLIESAIFKMHESMSEFRELYRTAFSEDSTADSIKGS